MPRHFVRAVASFAFASATIFAVGGASFADSISRAGSSVSVAATSEQEVSAFGAIVVVTGEAKSINAAGANVSVTATTAEGVRAAGADLTIDGKIGGEINAIGGRVTLRGTAGKGVWAGGANVDADMAIGGDMKTGGGKVVLGPATDIAGSLYAGGGEVTVSGHVAGAVNLTGGKVVFDGRADKAVSIEAEEVAIGPNAVIAGDLVLVGGTTAVVDPAAKIAGGTRNVEHEAWWKGPKVDPRPGQIGFALFIAGTAVLAGLGLLLLGRNSFDEAASRVRSRPAIDFVIGLVTVVLIPIVALALAFTGIGMPIAFGLVLLIPLLLIIGHATFAIGISDWIFNRDEEPRTAGRSILFLVVGAVGTAIAGAIPVAGPFIVFVVLLLGLGAFLATLRRRLTAG
jgi:cytoskeletal protein CcmA (bactofilin family)